MPRDSTVNQLTDLYITFCQALGEGKEVRAIFCDINKAFDRVMHKGLLVISQKRLGVVLSNECTWHEHLEYIKSKTWTRINIM